MQASASQEPNRDVGDLPRYNEIHVDHEVVVTSSDQRPSVSPRRPTYSFTPTVYSRSGSSTYSQSSHEQESPATSIDRSSEPLSEGTMANLDTMLMSRNVSLSGPHHAKTSADVFGHRELRDFLLNCEPPPENLMSAPPVSVPENSDNVARKGSFKIFARKSTRRRKSNRLLRLPESAVAATTNKGTKHIAISIRPDYEHSDVSPQYQYNALAKVPDSQPRTPQKLQKPAARVAGSAKTSRNVSTSSSARTGNVSARRPVVEAAVARAPNRNSSVRVNVEHGPWTMEPPSSSQSASLAIRSRTDSSTSAAIGADSARLLQRFWEQHPSTESRHELTGSNQTPSRMPEGTQVSPGRQGSEMTDPRHSGGTVYSERTLQTATASGGHSRESSGQSNSSNQLSGAKLVNIGAHPARTSSKFRDPNPRPITPRQFALRPAKPAAIPAETHNGDNDLISLSGFLGSPSSYSSRKPPQPGPAPNRKLPDLPEGSDVSRNASSSSNNQPRQRVNTATLPSQSSQSASSRAAFENASTRKETSDYPDHPANRSTTATVDRQDSVRSARQIRQERVRAKKQRDIARLKGLNIVKAQSVQSGAGGGGESSQSYILSSSLSPRSLENGVSSKGSVRDARKRSECLLPAPLDLSRIPSFSPSERPGTSRSLPVTTTTRAAYDDGNGLPASSFGSGNGKGSVRHARKRSEGLMSPLEKVQASSANASMLHNPSLRAAANALSNIMVADSVNPHSTKSAPHPSQQSIPSHGSGSSQLVNVFPLPPRSPKRISPRALVTVGSSAHGTQTPPRSPSPSLQSSDEEGSLNDGGRTTGIGVSVSLKSPLRSQGKSSMITKSSRPSTSRTKSVAVVPTTSSTQPPQRSGSRGHTRSGSGSQGARSTHPPPSTQTSNMNSLQNPAGATLTAAINAFELHRSARRQERNRILRDRRAREIAYNKERAAYEEATTLHLSKGDERQDAVEGILDAVEERLKRIEEKSDDMGMKYDVLVRLAGEMEDIKGVVRGLEDRFAASESSHNVEVMTPVPGNMTARGMRIDISMPPSSCGDSSVAHGRSSLSTSATVGRSLPGAFYTEINDSELEEDEEELPQYSGRGESESLGGGLGAGVGAPARSVTPIGSLIEELSSAGKEKSPRGSGVTSRSGMRSVSRSGPRSDVGSSVGRAVGKRKGRGSRDGDIQYSGIYGGRGWNGSVSTVGGVVGEVERGLVVSDLE